MEAVTPSCSAAFHMCEDIGRLNKRREKTDANIDLRGAGVRSAATQVVRPLLSCDDHLHLRTVSSVGIVAVNVGALGPCLLYFVHDWSMMVSWRWGTSHVMMQAFVGQTSCHTCAGSCQCDASE